VQMFLNIVQYCEILTNIAKYRQLFAHIAKYYNILTNTAKYYPTLSNSVFFNVAKYGQGVRWLFLPLSFGAPFTNITPIHKNNIILRRVANFGRMSNPIQPWSFTKAKPTSTATPISIATHIDNSWILKLYAPIHALPTSGATIHATYDSSTLAKYPNRSCRQIEISFTLKTSRYSVNVDTAQTLTV
jgi:hypothetical protein